MHKTCPVSLMDKTMDSGSINVGSIPIRDASLSTDFLPGLCSFTISLGDTMNIRCGIDIIELDRISRALDNGDSFKNKVFTANERAYCEDRGKGSLQSYAARFCAKEAVAKALGTGISKGISFLDIEVLNDENGKPIINLYGEAERIYKILGSNAIDISLTHSRDYAAAQAVILTEE